MLHQVEYGIHGYLLPLTIGKLHISERLLLEQGYGDNVNTIAYIGVKDHPRFFHQANSYLQFFLQILALFGGMSVTYTQGPAIEITTLDDLGKRKVIGYERVQVLHEDMENSMSRPILLVKQQFCELERDQHKIMNNDIGIALRHYYFALQATSVNRLDAMIRDLATSLEALFKERRENSPKIIEKISCFIDDDSPKHQIIDQMSRFYKLRNEVVHGAKTKFTHEDIRVTLSMKKHVQKALMKALSLRIYTKDKLNDYFSNTSF